MPVIVYSCPKCDRTIEIVQNATGMESVNNKCVITQNCTGTMNLKEIKRDYTRATTLADSTIGLTNWSKRRALYVYTQDYATTTWTITHNLGAYPKCDVFVEDSSGSLVATEDYTIGDITPFQLVLTFTSEFQGVAHVMPLTTVSDSDFLQLQADVATLDASTDSTSSVTTETVSAKDGVITLAVRYDVAIDKLQLHTKQISTNVLYNFSIGQTAEVSAYSAWTDYTRVVINGRVYKLYTFFLADNSTIADDSLGYDISINYVSGASLSANTVFLLLSTSPYSSVDTVTDSLIDMANINFDATSTTMISSGSKLLAPTTMVESIFPPITAS